MVDVLDDRFVDDQEVASRRRFYQLTDDDLVRLREVRPIAERHMDAIVDDFYRHLLGHEGSAAFLTDETVVRRLKETQRRYFIELFGGRCDKEYVRGRLKVGAMHERIGLPPKWYLGAYNLYLKLLFDKLATEIPDVDELHRTYRSVEKLVFFDTSLAIDAYVRRHLETLSRHQAAIRELSTPVIKMHDRLLLLPIVGTVDSLRAQQIMETVLVRVVEEQAKVIIIDIAGVPVVDTQVADHLLKTTSAVRLLGAQSVLTGISAQVARTMVELGVEITTMHTRSRLSDGIELALTMLGKTIVATEASK